MITKLLKGLLVYYQSDIKTFFVCKMFLKMNRSTKVFHSTKQIFYGLITSQMTLKSLSKLHLQ